ncbi:MAG: hypothetical protein GEV10_14890 [Streptosporangiales bacterium]|nr:hypothetical protein [Streptosporangiales bacterium]
MTDGSSVVFTDIPGRDLDLEQSILSSAGVEARVMEEARPLAEQVAEARGIVTLFGQVPADAIGAAPHLLTVARYGVGVDNIDVACASRRDVVVTNVPSYCENEVAEHVIALLFASARKVCVLDRDVRAGNWRLDPARPIYPIAGRTLGLVGFGRTARAVCQKAHALSLRVLVHSPRTSAESIEELGAERVDDLATLLGASHFVSLHTSLTPQTEGLIGREQLALMRHDAFLVNASRGGVVDAYALADALRAESIAGAALDVFDPETPPADHPLRGLENVIITPHVAYYSEESMLRLRRRTAQNVVAVLTGRMPGSVVNPAVLESHRWRGRLVENGNGERCDDVAGSSAGTGEVRAAAPDSAHS